MLKLASRFGKENKGYAIALTLVAMPLIVGISLFVIDGSRVANLNTDLANAVNSMAIAGARELDGRITRLRGQNQRLQRSSITTRPSAKVVVVSVSALD